MVETITPVVYGGRNRSYWFGVALHVLGATLSAAALGLVLGGLGALVGAPWSDGAWWLLVAVAAAYALREAFRLPLPLPDLDRQVPAWWRTFYSPGVASFLYGLGLGVGFITFLSFGTFVAVAVGAFLSGGPLLGALITAPFGFARGLSILVAIHNVDGREGSEIRDVLERTALGNGPRFVNAGVLMAIAIGAALI